VNEGLFSDGADDGERRRSSPTCWSVDSCCTHSLARQRFPTTTMTTEIGALTIAIELSWLLIVHSLITKWRPSANVTTCSSPSVSFGPASAQIHSTSLKLHIPWSRAHAKRFSRTSHPAWLPSCVLLMSSYLNYFFASFCLR
jgi:hypothetical protein